MVRNAQGYVAAAVVLIGAASSCNRSTVGEVASATTTTAASSKSSRTLYNVGWVDNAGRTSEITTRSEMSGMRATEVGSEKPTGTPGSGTPLPGTGGARRPGATGRTGEPTPRSRR